MTDLGVRSKSFERGPNRRGIAVRLFGAPSPSCVDEDILEIRSGKRRKDNRLLTGRHRGLAGGRLRTSSERSA
ncbi:MAG: hypothetical protein QOF33_3267 [Thermomicrobiales bacterium]|nr:hypothetical protein [Thermomicrobiales bacterium]